MLKQFVFALVSALTMSASIVAAQTPSVVTGTPFSVTAGHDGANTDGYRLFVDGVQVGTDVPRAQALAGTTVTLTAPAGVAARGAHTVAIEAFNADRTARTAALAFIATLAPPVTPSSLQFVVVTTAADGAITFKLLDPAAARQALELPPLK